MAQLPDPIKLSQIPTSEAGGEPLHGLYMTRGMILLLLAAAKLGKTTYLGHYMKFASNGGGHLGQPITGCRIGYVSEEPICISQPRSKLLKYGHVPHWTPGKLWDVGWGELVNGLVERADDFDVFIIDTFGYHAKLSESQENDSGIVQARLGMLRRITEKGPGVIVSHHKGRRSDYWAARGSSAFEAAVDSILVLEGQPNSRRRTLQCKSRAPEPIDKAVIELSQDGSEYWDRSVPA